MFGSGLEPIRKVHKESRCIAMPFTDHDRKNYAAKQHWQISFTRRKASLRGMFPAFCHALSHNLYILGVFCIDCMIRGVADISRCVG